ncbi:MAG: spondin domain-containing protein [Nitrospirota bacterium]|nr:spondin domain-containing protein [Nitrospirota bacterium]
MNHTIVIRGLAVAGALSAALLAGGCQDAAKVAPALYTVTYTNATHGQPLAPAAVVLHTPGYTPWQIGAAASDGLELLAEGGDPSGFVNEAAADTAVADAASGAGLTLPGNARTVTVGAPRRPDMRISVAAMLGATNDGFAGLKDALVGDMAAGESRTFPLSVYDAGTEANTETAATVPALMGTGYDAARDDLRDQVTLHAGVVTADDGLATSGLGEGHRWLGPGAMVTVQRDR